MTAIGGNITTMRRQLKNVVGNYSCAQVKVREATSNDPWGPSSSLMSEIADLSHNSVAFSEVMQMLWKRLNDSGKNWRHVYKSLVVLDYLVKLGSEKVAQQCRENIFAVQTLKDFQHVEDNKDQGMNVREKAKQLVALLKDEERLKNERLKAMAAKSRFVQHGMGISSDGTTSRVKKSETFNYDKALSKTSPPRRNRRSSELDECRPTSTGEEELQLQIALALSKEDAQKEEELRKSDDVRLQMALNQSQQSQSSTDKNCSFDATLATGFADCFDLPGSSQQACGTKFADPWASPPTYGQSVQQPADLGKTDPWGDSATGRASISSADPWAVPSNKGPVAHVDPWASHHINSVPAVNKSASNVTDAVQFGYSPGQVGNFDDFDPFGPTANNSNGNKLTSKRSKTPADFLGENSALVNLDNLLGPAKPPSSHQTGAPGATPAGAGVHSGRASTNPFLAATDLGTHGPSGDPGLSGTAPAAYPSSAYNRQRSASTNPFL